MSKHHKYILQESPSAWTQEAYRPPCNKYSLCCPNWVPPPPHPDQAGGGVPWLGTLPGQGTPPDRVPPAGYPPPGCPMAFLGNVANALWDMGTPPPAVDRQKDRHVSKHYLPVVLRTRAVKISLTFHLRCKNQMEVHQGLLPLCTVSEKVL